MEERKTRKHIRTKTLQGTTKSRASIGKADRISKEYRLARECAKLDPREERALAEGELEY